MTRNWLRSQLGRAISETDKWPKWRRESVDNEQTCEEAVQDCWTQEEIDAANKKGAELEKFFNG